MDENSTSAVKEEASRREATLNKTTLNTAVLNKASLNPATQRSLEIVLCEMERLVQASHQMRAIAQSGIGQGVMLRLHTTLDHNQLTQLEALENAALKQLSELRDSLELNPRDEELQTQLFGAFLNLWTDLIDERPEMLLRYGSLTPEAAIVLEPAIENLLRISECFTAILVKREPK